MILRMMPISYICLLKLEKLQTLCLFVILERVVMKTGCIFFDLLSCRLCRLWLLKRLNLKHSFFKTLHKNTEHTHKDTYTHCTYTLSKLTRIHTHTSQTHWTYSHGFTHKHMHCTHKFYAHKPNMSERRHYEGEGEKRYAIWNYFPITYKCSKSLGRVPHIKLNLKC